MSQSPAAPTRRSFLKLAGSLSVGAALTACAPGGGSSPGGSSGGGKGSTITVGMEAGSPYQTFYSAMAPRFTKETGIKVKILGVPHDNMHQQFLSDALSGTGAYDVYESDQPWIPEFASKGFLVDLDDKISASDRKDFAGHTLDTVSYQGKLYALPFLVHNTVLYYRTDLFEQAGIKAPPTTWAEYRDYAKKLTSSGVHGTLVEGQQDGECAIRLEAFIQQAGGDIADANLKPTMNTPQALAAAGLMTGIVGDGSAPSGLVNLTDMQGLFLQGKLAMAPCWPYLYALAKDPKQSKVVDKFAVALSPGNPDQVSTTFSWGFGVASGSKNQDAAWQWVDWATSTAVQAAFGRNQINPVPRASAVAKISADRSLSAADRKAIATFAESAKRSKSMPMTPLYPQWQEAMAVAVSGIMSGSAKPASALAAAQAKMQSAA